MKYVYGKRIKTLRERLTSGLASLVLLANTVGMSLPLLLTQRAAADAGYSYNSTNQLNKDKQTPGRVGQNAPYVELVSATYSDVTLKFNNPSPFFTCFEYRTDGDTSQVNGSNPADYPNPEKYPRSCITNTSEQKTFSPLQYVEIRVALGPESDFFFDWTRFDTAYGVCTYDFQADKMWEVTWGYGFEDRNGGAPVFNTASNGGLVSVNGASVPSYITSYDATHGAGAWHWLYVTDNGNYNPRHIEYGFADGTVRAVDYTWSEVNGCNIPTIEWSFVPTISFVANYIDNSQYGGISLEIETPNLTDGTSVEIIVNRTNGAPDVWTNKSATPLNSLNGSSHVTTAPIVIVEGTRTRTSSGSWQTTGTPWTNDQEPTSVTVRVTRAGGPTLEQTVSLIGSPWGATWPQIAAQLPVSDTTAPLAVINTPANNSLFNGGVLSVTGHVSDNIGMSHYSMYLYNGTVDLSDGEVHSSSRITTPGGWTAGGQTNVAGLLNQDVSRTLDLSLLDDGEYQIRLAVRDLAGNRNASDSVDVVRFTVDKTAPEVSGVVLNGEAVTVARDVNCGPTDFNVVGSTVNLSATITDNLSGVKKAVYKIRKVTNGGCTQTAIYQSSTVNMSNSVADEWVTLPGSELDTSGIPDGNYTIQMTVTDNADNTVTKYVDITVDNTAPAAPAITAPGTRQWFSGSSTVNSWTVPADDSGIAEYEVMYEFVGRATSYRYTSTNSRTQSFTGSYQGPITISVRARDNAGNWSAYSAPVTYNYDSVAPATDIVVSEVVDGIFTVSGDASDNLNLNRVYVQLVSRVSGARCGGTTINLIPEGAASDWSVTYDIATLMSVSATPVPCPEGLYAAHVAVVDMAGNTSSAGWTENFMVAAPAAGSVDDGEVQGAEDCDGDGITDPNGCENGNGSRASTAGTNDILNRAQGGQVLAATTGLAGTGTQHGGILMVLAAGLLGLALLVTRRRQQN